MEYGTEGIEFYLKVSNETNDFLQLLKVSPRKNKMEHSHSKSCFQ